MCGSEVPGAPTFSSPKSCLSKRTSGEPMIFTATPSRQRPRNISFSEDVEVIEFGHGLGDGPEGPLSRPIDLSRSSLCWHGIGVVIQWACSEHEMYETEEERREARHIALLF